MIEWEDKYSVGVSVIDKEHKKFFDIINRATYIKKYNDSPKGISEILVEMTVHAQEHFKTEETHMISSKYYDYKSHKDEHNNFSNITSKYINKLMDVEIKSIGEILEDLTQWLFNHIQVTDKKYVACFNENGFK